MTSQVNSFWEEYHLVVKAIISALIFAVCWFASKQLEGIEKSIDRVANGVEAVQSEMQKQKEVSLRNSYRLDACEKAIKDCGQ